MCNGAIYGRLSMCSGAILSVISGDGQAYMSVTTLQLYGVICIGILRMDLKLFLTSGLMGELMGYDLLIGLWD